MSKGDKIKVEYQIADRAAVVEVKAETNGSSVETRDDRDWLYVEVLTKANKVSKTVKVKKSSVVAVEEIPIRPPRN